MNSMEQNKTVDSLERYAMALASLRCEGLEERCCHHRRWATVRRVAFATMLLGLLTVAASVGAEAIASLPRAKGILPVNVAMENVNEMLAKL